MALNKRQMACFERNGQFLDEVAVAAMRWAAQTKAAAIAVLTNAASTETEQEFARVRSNLAEQILREQGVNLQGSAAYTGNVTATGGSTGMRYLVQQLLMLDSWTLTPDAWAANETTARATIQLALTAMLDAMTALPDSPQAAAFAVAEQSKRGKK